MPRAPLSPSVLLVPVLALALGTGGHALTDTGDTVSSGTVKPGVTKSEVKKLAKKIAKKEGKKAVRRAAPGLTVKTAANAQHANTATLAFAAQRVADNAVTGASVADRSLSAVDVAVAHGTAILDIPAVQPNDCRLAAHDTGVDLTNAAVAVNAGTGGGLSTGSISLHVAKDPSPTVFRVVACNVGATDPVDPPPLPFDFVALR